MSENNNNLIFARNLVNYINRSGKTQKEISVELGIAYSSFNDWCTGKKYPRIGKIELLANYFGCEKSDLIEDKTRKPTENDGLSEKKQALIDFVKSVPDDKAEMILRVIRSIVEAD